MLVVYKCSQDCAFANIQMCEHNFRNMPYGEHRHMAVDRNDWTKASWRSFPALQQPSWPDPREYEEALCSLSELPALVFAGETRALVQGLAVASAGKAFVLQCGECAEDFSFCHGPRIHSMVKVILQMSVIIAYAGEKRVVNIGRLAGQYAKPRSSETENVGGRELPSYRGDMVNALDPESDARVPNARRLLEGYFRAAATLNLVRAFSGGGYASLEMVDEWHRDFLRAFPENKKYIQLSRGIRKAVNFAGAMGLDVKTPQLNQVMIYTSHEALLLGYEESMTRVDTTTGDWYDTSAHMLWIGDRTRQVDGAHVEFLRGVGNPIGVKIGPSHDIDDLKRLAVKLNPANIPGKLVFISRLGAQRVEDLLPGLLKEMKQEGFEILWMCDPMHGNTFVNDRSIKTRKFEDILKETKSFFCVHRALGTVPGGVHLELTGEAVTECIGGTGRLGHDDLGRNYLSNCDPRLNAEQSIELAFEIADILQGWVK